MTRFYGPIVQPCITGSFQVSIMLWFQSSSDHDNGCYNDTNNGWPKTHFGLKNGLCRWYLRGVVRGPLPGRRTGARGRERAPAECIPYILYARPFAAAPPPPPPPPPPPSPPARAHAHVHARPCAPPKTRNSYALARGARFTKNRSAQ